MGILLNGFSQVGFCRVAIWGVEDRPEFFSQFPAHFLPGHMGASVLLQVELAALPGNPAKDGDPSGFQPGVVIAGDKLDAVQAACQQALQEGPPVHFMLAQGDQDAQDLTLAVQPNPDRKQDGGIPCQCR